MNAVVEAVVIVVEVIDVMVVMEVGDCGSSFQSRTPVTATTSNSIVTPITAMHVLLLMACLGGGGMGVACNKNINYNQSPVKSDIPQ